MKPPSSFPQPLLDETFRSHDGQNPAEFSQIGASAQLFQKGAFENSLPHWNDGFHAQYICIYCHMYIYMYIVWILYIDIDIDVDIDINIDIDIDINIDIRYRYRHRMT